MQKILEIKTLKVSRDIPQSSGVYLFMDEHKNVLYIGKALNLQNRISSYFSKLVTGKTQIMVASSKYLSFIKVNTELDALLLEAELVNKIQPKYNIQLKDDKSPLYIMISKDKYPIISIVRKKELINYKKYYGPFKNSNIIRSIIKYLRKIFPYSEHLPSEKPCLYSQMHLCDPCPSVIESADTEHKIILKKVYMDNIRNIEKVLSRKTSKLMLDLNNKMQYFSKKNMFEEALKIKKQLSMLEYVTQEIYLLDDYLKNPNFLEDIRNQEINSLINTLSDYINIKKKNRIECFDVAHISGIATTASMVTFINGEPNKNYYRKFMLRKNKKYDDISACQEVIQRRANHFSDWGKPDLVVIDGGAGQLSVASEILNQYNIPTIGFAKRPDKIVLNSKDGIKKILKIETNALNLLLRLRNEAHRFARLYHHTLLRKNLLLS